MDNANKYNNISFLEFRPHYWRLDCIFRLAPEIADGIRKNTRSSEKVLNYYLDADNRFVFPIESKDTDYWEPIVETIERISNSKDSKYVINNLITDNGIFNNFCRVRNLLEEEFDLKDRTMQLRVMSFYSSVERLWFNIW